MRGDCDFAVVGGGILGLAVARELLRRHPNASLTLLEKEPELAAHQSGRSSGVIHAGIYYAPGSLKARLCVQGARRLYEYCAERGIEARRDGKLIVATEEAELARLDELERRGRANQVPGLRRVEADEIAEIEPHARGLVALHSPATGVVDFGAVARAIAEDVRGEGGEIATGVEIVRIETRADRIELHHRSGLLVAAFAVFCAGAWSDRLAALAGAEPEPRIIPFRGAYLRLRPERRRLVRASIYPVPDPELPFLGAHLTRTIDGEVLAGPTALMVGALDADRPWRIRPPELRRTLAWPGTWRLARRFWRAGLGELAHAASRRSFVRTVRRAVPEMRTADFLRGPAGIRAQALGRDGRLIDDFVMSHTERALHVRNAPSPAATSCLALAAEIADEVERRRA